MTNHSVFHSVTACREHAWPRLRTAKVPAHHDVQFHELIGTERLAWQHRVLFAGDGGHTTTRRHDLTDPISQQEIPGFRRFYADLCLKR